MENIINIWETKISEKEWKSRNRTKELIEIQNELGIINQRFSAFEYATQQLARKSVNSAELSKLVKDSGLIPDESDIFGDQHNILLGGKEIISGSTDDVRNKLNDLWSKMGVLK